MYRTDLVLKADPRPTMWVVYEPLVWYDPIFGTVVTPVGATTNLASTGVLRAMPSFDPDGLSRRPAVSHDFAYSRGFGWTKEQADLFLKAALIAEGASLELAEMYYQGVHLFGQPYWDAAAGTLATTDFDTHEHYEQWLAMQPIATVIVKG